MSVLSHYLLLKVTEIPLSEFLSPSIQQTQLLVRKINLAHTVKQTQTKTQSAHEKWKQAGAELCQSQLS